MTSGTMDDALKWMKILNKNRVFYQKNTHVLAYTSVNIKKKSQN